MAANDKEVLMKADHVKVYFKGKKKGQTVKAVDDVSFEIMKGETFGVVGESGCGKSTLGRTLIRLQQPTDGHIYLNGTDIAGLKGAQLKEMRKEAQIIFQDPSACLNPRRTIKQILMEPFEIHNLKGKIDVDAKIMERRGPSQASRFAMPVLYNFRTVFAVSDPADRGVHHQ